MEVMDIWVLYLIVAVLVLMFLFFLFSRHLENKRSKALQQTASSLGFSFEENPTYDYEALDLILFHTGRPEKLYNLMRGKKGFLPLEIFDYNYTVGAGKHSLTYRQTVVLATLDKNLPEFTLGPEGFFHKVGELLGYNDIDFDQHPTFSKSYLLRGDDETTIRTLFTPKVISYIEKIPYAITVEAFENKIAYYSATVRIKPKKMTEFIEEASHLFSLF